MAIVVILLFLAALGYPYWWSAILRYRMLRRLGQTCRAHGYRLRSLRGTLLFVRNRGQKYDFLIENKEQVFAVKLWSAYRRDSALVITRNLRIFERRYAPILLDVRRDAKAARSEGRARVVPRTKLSLSAKDSRKLTRVLLVYPSYSAILRQETAGERRLRSGDLVFDKQLHTPSSLEGLLNREPQETVNAENFKQI